MKQLIKTIFQSPKFWKNLFITIFLTIITFCIGIITHEIGHAIAGKVFDYKNIRVSYKSTSMQSKYQDTLKLINKLRKHELKNNLNYPEKEYYDQYHTTPRIYMLSGANILTFTLGFFAWLMLYARPNFLQFHSYLSYCCFYLSLFLGQFISDGIILLINVILEKPTQMDLVKVAYLLYLPRFSLVICMFVLATLLLFYLFFKLVPIEKRGYLIIGICLGTIIARVLWFNFLGIMVLP